MKIVILGAGQVGSTVAESLVSESNDITIVDQSRSNLIPLQERLDLRTVVGYASHPDVMTEAGMEDADMLLALTGSDETNLVACKLAASLFNTPTRIARIRTVDYLDHPDIFSKENFCVDFAICPERILTNYIEKLIEFPGALQVLDFASGKVSLVAVKAVRGGSLVGRQLADLRHHVPDLETRVAAVFRHNHPIIPEGSTVIAEGDEVFFVASSYDIRAVMRELRRMDKSVKRVMIAGGGRIGQRLAEVLQSTYQVRIVEHDIKVCESLTQNLHKVLVLHGDATDEELLESENISEMDIFCALTDNEENNIMAALMAKRKGARKVIALINRSIYVDLMQGSGIDIAISPAQVTIGSLLTYVRQGDVAAVHSLRRGAAEALELVAHGDSHSSRIVGRKVGDIKLPRGATIGAIVRGLPPGDIYHQNITEDEEKDFLERRDQATVIIAHSDTIIEQNDHVILFVINKKMVQQVEKLFQVKVSFL
ncbi:Trk system potassium uptake protein TrkA [Nitrosomonas stercoris]|uniref:Trk system potassium uptake protein TrkA n=1 Tax=Nitrosomonas stercoris TaxID=1444684 RepID=A0A4Y1YRK2_9PROT|nr:Trk system potassium uptake protein TrkA [Nitrosomonas stercoris]